MEKSKLLDRCGAEGEDRLLLAKVLDRAAQAEERNIPACTDFLSPQQQMMAGDLLRLAGIPETAWLRHLKKKKVKKMSKTGNQMTSDSV